MPDYIEKNRIYWDSLVDGHTQSEFYQQSKEQLDPLVQTLLGNVAGQKLLHLQCHFGQDTLVLARQGACVAGVDFSARAVQVANEQAQKKNLNARFFEGNVLDLDLQEQFETGFSSWGAIGWLNDLRAWGQVVARHIAPGGRFILVEGHPILWMMDEELPIRLKYPYSSFHRAPGDPIVEAAGGVSYAGAEKKHPSYGWNHSISEIIGALLGAGFSLIRFEEYDRVPWEPWPGMVKVGPYWELPEDVLRFPLAFGLEVRRSSST